MSGHSRWSTTKDWGEISEALGGETALQNMIQFCQGYILALEDMLKDIDELDPPNYRYWELIRKVKDSIGQTERTLTLLQKKVDDAE